VLALTHTSSVLFPSDTPPELNAEKFKALVHYVCDQAPNPKRLGATKLNKILFYSDMEAYLLRRRPITGESYVKRQHGPVPQHVLPTLRELERERALAISEASGYNVYRGTFRQRRFYSLRPPNLSLFDGDEIRIVDEMVRAICNEHSARSISARSHDVIWESAELGEVIPYFTVYSHFLRSPSDTDRAWAVGWLRERQRGAHGSPQA
jgi:hypothetical protein